MIQSHVDELKIISTIKMAFSKLVKTFQKEK